MSMNSRDVIVVVSKCVNEAIEQAHMLFSADLPNFVLFLEKIFTTLQPRHLTTTEGISSIKNMLANETERDYLVTLDMLVHVSIADQYLLYKQLLEVLVNSMSFAGFIGDRAGVAKPQSIYEDAYLERVASSSVNQELLASNKLLVTLYCILLWGKPRYQIVERKVGQGMAMVAEILPTRAEIIAAMAQVENANGKK